MIEELHKLFEVFGHLRDLPQYVNLRKHVTERIQKLEDDLAKKVEVAQPKAIPSTAPEPEEIERRV